MQFRTASFALIAALTSAAAVACTVETITAPATTPAVGAAPTPDKGTPANDAAAAPLAVPANMNAIVASKLTADLTAAGVDIEQLPTMDVLKKDSKKLMAVMKAFKTSLGVECTGCHEANPDGGRPNFAAATPEKRVAGKMWDRFVGKMTIADGAVLFCDSCHQGKKEFVDHENPEGVAKWMKENFIAKLKQKDGAAQACTNCHGTPFDPDFLAKWESATEE